MWRQAIWDHYCALTCVGGSEQKDCPCERPTDCKLSGAPGFRLARERATARLFAPLVDLVKKRKR